MRRIGPFRAAVAAVLVLASAACGSRHDREVRVLAIGAPEAPFETGVRLSPPAQLVRAATAEGLVAFDAQGRIVPALADRWIVTDDGQSYIFRLRDGTWLDGGALTGESARAALRLALSRLRGTSLALDLAPIVEVRAMAARVIEIRLGQPVPELLQILAQPELGLLRRGVGAGPMALRREGNAALLTAIAPTARGLPAVADWSELTRPVRLEAAPTAAAVARFDEGEADVVLGGRVEDFPLASGAGLRRGAIRFDAVTGLFGLLAVTERGFLAAAENREAIALAIDREALIGALGLSGWTPSTRIVAPPPDSPPLAERWADLSLDQRRAVAAARVRRWTTAQAPAAPLRLFLPPGPGAQILFERLRGDLAAIGLAVTRATAPEAADLRLVDLVARYPDPRWILNQLSCTVLKGLCSAAADALSAQARATPAAAERAALLAQAEAELTGANIYIPFGPPIRWSLVGGAVNGFEPNRTGVHPLMALALRPT